MQGPHRALFQFTVASSMTMLKFFMQPVESPPAGLLIECRWPRFPDLEVPCWLLLCNCCVAVVHLCGLVCSSRLSVCPVLPSVDVDDGPQKHV